MVLTEVFDRQLTDVLELQAEIAEKLAVALNIELTGADEIQIIGQPTSNKQAYDLYLQGRYFLKNRNQKQQNLYLNFSANPGAAGLNDVIASVEKVFGKYHLKRFDENSDHFEASFLIDSSGPERMASFSKEAEKYGDSVRISFVESKSF